MADFGDLTKKDIEEAFESGKLRMIGLKHAAPPYQTHFIIKTCRGCIREAIMGNHHHGAEPLPADAHADWCMKPLARAAAEAAGG